MIRTPLLPFLIAVIPSVLCAAPEGGNVVAGQAAISKPTALTTSVLQSSQSAIINWKDFSIDVNELVKFLQPNADAVALNRVTGVDPSSILGELIANGRVFLVNPNGILFGPHSKVDVGSLIATTFSLEEGDFLAGKYNFTQKPGAKPTFVVNQGQIKVAKNGAAFLVASGVKNEGLIIAHLGTVVLGSGGKLKVDFRGDGLITYSVEGKVLESVIGSNGKPLSDSVGNSGTITNPGGTVALTGDAAREVATSVVNQEGLIEAQSLTKRDGKLLLEARSDGAVANSGTLSASGAGPGTTGGAVTVTGEQVLVSGAIDASGDAGGGTIKVGGGFQGNDPAVRNATSATVTESATLVADALSAGNGGTVVAWADGETSFAGQISATGGPLGGDGGFAEVSGLERLNYTGVADLTAPEGRTGTLLLDPNDVEVNTVSTIATASLVTPTAITTNLATSSVVVQTAPRLHNGSTIDDGEPGDVFVNAAVNYTSASDFAILANRNVRFNASVQNNYTGTVGGAVTIVAGWDGVTGLTWASTIDPPTTPVLGFGFVNFADIIDGVAHPNAYGNSSGSVSIGDGGQLSGIAVGSRGGATNVAGHRLTLTGGTSGTRPYAQLGFRRESTQSNFSINGPITVALASDLTATAGTQQHAYAQVGHGGGDFDGGGTNEPDGAFQGDITIVRAQNLNFTGGSSSPYAYAQLGHGGYDADGNHSGTITLTDLANLSFLGGAANYAYAQLGHGGWSASGTQTAGITLPQAANLTFTGGSGTGSYVQLGNGGDSANGNHGGSIALGTVTDLAFTGGVGDNAYAQLGHGGHAAAGSHSGTLTITQANDVEFRGGPGLGDGAYAQLGHGGYDADGTHTGAITTSTLSGDLVFTGGAGDYAFAQLGHGGDGSYGNHTGSVTLSDVQNLTFTAGAGDQSYAQLGHGGYDADGNLDGTLSIVSAQEVLFLGGPSAQAYAQLGHGGFESDGTDSGTLTIGQAHDLILGNTAGTHDAYSQLGHGGHMADGTHSGAVSVTLTGSATLTGGDGSYAYAQVGHGGYGANGNDLNSITLAAAGDLTLVGGNAVKAYAQVGHGDAAKVGTQLRQGNLLLTVGGETSLVNGTAGTSPWLIGHATATGGGVSNADVTLSSGTLDYSKSSGSTAFNINDDFGAKMSTNLASGNVALTATNLTAGATGGMAMDGAFTYSTGTTLSLTSNRDARFSDQITNSGSGPVSVTVGGSATMALGSGITTNSGGIDMAVGTLNTGSVDILRNLVSSGPVTIDGAGGADLITLLGIAGIGTTAVNGAGDDDTITVDFSAGNPIPFGGLAYDGGAETTPDGDVLILQNGIFATVTHALASASTGGVDLDGSAITYTGLEPITDTLTVGARIFTFNAADNIITLGDDGIGGNNLNRVSSVASSERVDFTSPTTSLTLNAGGGNDTVALNALDSAFGAATVALNGNAGNDAFILVDREPTTIDGGADTDSANYSALGAGAEITLGTEVTNVETLTGNDAGFTLANGTTWAVTGPNSGTVDGITFVKWANLTGSAGADTFTLNGGTLTGAINGAAGTDTLIGDNVANAFAVTGANSGTATGVGAGFTNVENLTGNAKDDTFTFTGGTLSGAVNGAGGTDALIGDNVANAFVVTGANAGTATGLGAGFTNVENLTGNAKADTFTLTGGTLSGAVNGAGGTDTLIGDNVANAFVVTGPNAGTATGLGTGFRNVENLTGNAKADTFTLTGGTLAGAVNGAGGTDTLIGDNVANAFVVTGANAGTATGLDAGFVNVENLTGNAMADTFTLTGGTLTGAVNGAGGTDTLIGDNVANAFVVTGANAGTATGLGAGFLNVENLTGNAKADTFTLTGGTLTGAVNGVGGSDTLIGDNVANVFVVSGANAGTATGLGAGFLNVENLTGNAKADTFTLTGGTLTGAVNGAGGSDTLIGDNVATAFVVTGANAGTATGLGAGFLNVENLTGNAKADTFTLTGGTLSGAVNGAGGSDTLIGDNVANAFVVTGANAGTATGLGAGFTNVENLTGNAKADTFTLKGGTLTGAVNGAAGSDTLIGDNAANAFVVIGANAGTATGLGAGFTNVENLTGNAKADTFTLNGGTLAGAVSGAAGTDTLIGDNVANAFVVTGANSGAATGLGAGFTNVENLTGNAKTDTFTLTGGGSLTGNVTGAGGSDTLIGDDVANAFAVNGANTGTATGIGGVWQQIENLTGNAQADTFTLTGGGTLTGNVGGAGGEDTLIGDDVANAFVINGADTGTATGIGGVWQQVENLTGNAQADTFTLTGGTLSGVVDGAAGSDTLIGDDVANAFVVTGAESGTATGVGGGFVNVENLTGNSPADAFALVGGTVSGVLDGAGGSDTLTGDDVPNAFVVTGADSGAATGTGGFVNVENLIGNAQADTFTVAGGTLTGAIDGAGGSDTLTGDNVANTFVLTGAQSGTATGIGAGFVSIENLTGNAQGDTFTVAGGSLSGTLSGGDGDDLIVIAGTAADDAFTADMGNAQIPGFVNAFAEVETLRFEGAAQDAADSLTIQASADDDLLTMTDGRWTVNGVNVDFPGIEALTVNGLEGDESFLLNALNPGTGCLTVDGGDGTDTATLTALGPLDNDLDLTAETILVSTSVSTGATQTYNGAMLLGADVALAGATVTLNGTVDDDGDALTTSNLTVNATDTQFNGLVGANAPLSSLTTDAAGTATVNTTVINTAGNTMTFNDALVLTQDVVLTDTGGTGISFGNTVDSNGTPRSLTIAAGSGSVSFGGAVGATVPLGELTVNSAHDVAVNATLAAAGVTQTAGTGTTTLNATVTATGATGISLTNAAVVQSADLVADGAAPVSVTSATGGITMADGTSSASGTGAISYTAATSVAVASLVTGGNVSVTAAAGALSNANGTATNVAASDLVATSTAGIDLDTAVTTATATVSAAGAISLNEADGATFTNVTTTDGPITITSGGTMKAVNVVADGAGNDATITTTAGDLVVDLVQSKQGNVNLTAVGKIVENPDAEVDIAGATLNLSAGTGIGTATEAIELSGNVLNATTNTGGIYLTEADAITLNSVIAQHGDIHLANLTPGMIVVQVQALDGGLFLTTPGSILATSAANQLTATANSELRAGGLIGLSTNAAYNYPLNLTFAGDDLFAYASGTPIEEVSVAFLGNPAIRHHLLVGGSGLGKFNDTAVSDDVAASDLMDRVLSLFRSWWSEDELDGLQFGIVTSDLVKPAEPVSGGFGALLGALLASAWTSAQPPQKPSVSPEQRERLDLMKSKGTEASLTILPVRLGGPGLPSEVAQARDFRDRVTEVAGCLLEQMGLKGIELGKTAFDSETDTTVGGLVASLTGFLKQHPVTTEYVVYANLRTDGITAVVTDATGALVWSDQLTAQDEPFKSGPPDSMAVCVALSDRLSPQFGLNEETRKAAKPGKITALGAARSGLPPEGERAALPARLAEMKKAMPKATLAVFPVRARKEDNPAETGSAADLARMINDAGLCKAEPAQQSLLLKTAQADPNEMKVLWDLAREFRDYAKAASVDADYVLYADHRFSAQQWEAGFVHFIVCDRNGDWVIVDLQNSHHSDYQSLKPTSKEGCDKLLVKRLKGYLE